MREAVALFTAVGAGAIFFASPAHADDNQFLAHVKSSGVVQPAVSDSELLFEGQQVCIEVGKQGMSPDVSRSWIYHELQGAGGAPNYAAAATVVHYALQDLCPQVPNTTGI